MRATQTVVFLTGLMKHIILPKQIFSIVIFKIFGLKNV